MTLEQVGTLVAIATTLLLAARVVIVAEAKLREHERRLDAKRVTIAEQEKLLQTQAQELVAFGRDLHALRSTVQAQELRVEKAIASLEQRVDKRLDSIEDLLRRALEPTGSGR